ncbi:MAG: UvrD-helicase domain-containing protein, partial [Candidatus Sericytochromatia bacterium]|nr:UvrD-helicase domain-containing protein [Candidatus Tanganyikabacteria bacterium]
QAQADRIAAALEAGDGSGLAPALAAVDFPRAPAGPKADREAADPELREAVLGWRREAAALLGAIRNGPLGGAARAEQAAAELRSLAEPMGLLIDLVHEFDEAFTRAKRRRNAVDFGDLEHLTLEVLRDSSGPGRPAPSEAALALRRRFRMILVDEYQDTNPVQEALLGLLASPSEDGAFEEANLFVVGDVKQSIYRFRMAEPHLFLRRAEAYGPDGPGPIRIDLQANFRSRPTVLGAVNHVFRAIMTPEAAELAYDRRAELVPGARYPAGDPPVEIHLLGGAGGDRRSKLEREAAAVAGRVAALLSGGATVWDGRRERPVAPGDVAILLRAANSAGGIFGAELARLGIPCHAQAGTGFFGTVEVETMLALLDILDNPRQDIPLAAVLRSPIGGLSPADLARVRLAHPAGDFFDALLAAAKAGGRAADFLDRLDAWRTVARRCPLSELVWRLLAESGYLAFSAALPGGAQREANLLSMYDLAREFDQFTRQGLFRFLRFVRRLEEAGEDLGMAPPAGEGADVVRILSVHRSKGLEFPVVFVAALGQRWNLRDLSSDLLIDRDLGLGPRIADQRARVKYPSLAQRVVAERLRRQALAEEMRILYVAMTRARERLLLFATPPDAGRWEEAAGAGVPISPDLVTSAAAPIDWIGLALAAAPAGDLFAITHVPEVPAAASPALAGGGARSEGDAAAAGAIAVRLSWTYAYSALARCPAKIAASHAPGDHAPGVEDEAPHPATLRPLLVERPRFVQAAATRLTAAERGTATHLLMQHLDFVADASRQGLAARLADLVEREILAPEAAAGIDAGAIADFVASDWGRRLAAAQAAGTLEREVAFSVKVPASAIRPDLPRHVAADEWVLMQGMIDAVIRDADGLVILDYKTDSGAQMTWRLSDAGTEACATDATGGAGLRAGRDAGAKSSEPRYDEPAGRDLEALAAAHAGQMRHYRAAAEAIFAMPVKQACLVFLAAGGVRNA